MCAPIGQQDEVYEMLTNAGNPSRILRMRHVTAQLAISRSTVNDWLDPKSPRYDCTFPKPIRLGRASIGWLSTDIAAFIEQRVTLRDLEVDGN